MGRKRKKNQGLPKGVYETKGKYRAKYWTGNKLANGGSGYGTPEEAEYTSHVIQHGHHWKDMNKENHWGFIYLITCRATGRMYIGKKQFLLWDGPVGGYKCTDLEDNWFDDGAWRNNDWKLYTGSQKDLNRDIRKGNIWDYKFEVLAMCKNKLDLHLAEVMFQMEADVLEALDDKGDYLYYNKNIAGQEFRAPFSKQDALTMRVVDEEALRNYYLKPDLDGEGHVLPYGHYKSTGMSLETGGFSDVS